ncbi:MAG: hypothetical protein HFJ17_01970 [Clostridia bacterium]|nr:hypothetical protein [Clostridia bacterium]
MENTEIIEKVAHIDERAKSNTKRLDEHDNRIDSLEKTYSVMEKMDCRIGNMENSVDEIKTEIKNSKEQKRYEMG